MADKYQPLTDRLAALAELDHQSVDMDFADIAALVAGLPPSAYRNRQWRTNSSLTQAAAWRAADWHADHVDFEREQVRFARGKVGSTRTTDGRAPGSGDNRTLFRCARWGCWAHRFVD